MRCGGASSEAPVPMTRTTPRALAIRALRFVEEAGIEEIGDFDLVHAAEDRIIGEK